MIAGSSATAAAPEGGELCFGDLLSRCRGRESSFGVTLHARRNCPKALVTSPTSLKQTPQS